MGLAACFFFNGKPTAAINDKAFARLFFGIWLSPKTSAPGLRNALIGKPVRHRRSHGTGWRYGLLGLPLAFVSLPL